MSFWILIPAAACGLAFGLKSPGYLRLFFIALLILFLAWHTIPVMQLHLTDSGWSGLSDIDPYGWAAFAVYKHSGDPYGKKGWLSFPFPVFPVLWAISRGGTLPDPEWKMHFFYLNLVLSLLNGILFFLPLWLSDNRKALGLLSGLLCMLLFLFSEGTARTLSQGQVNLMVAFFLGCLVCSLAFFQGYRSGGYFLLIMAGIFLALALLIKMIILPLFLFFCLRVVSRYAGLTGRNKGAGFFPERWIVTSAVISALLAMLATILIPGGISLEHYIGFFRKGVTMGVHDFLYRPMNFSPAAVLIRSDLVPASPAVISLILLTALAILASLKTLGAGRPLAPDLLPPWIYATLLWAPISWSHYACWSYGAFLLLLARTCHLSHGGKRLLFALMLFLGFGLTNIRANLLYLFGTLLLFLISCLMPSERMGVSSPSAAWPASSLSSS